MRRFTGLLLLVTCILSPLLFVNGLQPLQPAIHYNPSRRDAIIRGLLVTRQDACPDGWHTCNNGSCCGPMSYCLLGGNDIIGCCPSSEVCSGPAATPTTLHGPPPPTMTPPPPLPTPTGLLGGPSQSSLNQVIDVSVLNVNITWSEGWVLQTSTCDPSIKSMITSTVNSSFTYIQESNLGYLFYINAANYNVDWDVFLNGVVQSSFSGDLSGGSNCTYLLCGSLSDELTQNITVVARGLAFPKFTPTDSWALEINGLSLEIGYSLDTATFNAAGRAQPYGPLLVPGSVLLAAAISILRF